MKKIYTIFFLLFLLLKINVQSQSIKGLYVDGFSQILGSTVKEDSLLNYAQQNGFNYLALYDLWPVHVANNLTNLSSSAVLATFIQRAKQNFGVAQVGAIGENLFFFNNVIQIYNTQHTNPLQKFDVYNVEFEFWNTNSISAGDYYCTTYLQPGGYACDTVGAFSFYAKLIRQVDSLANIAGVISETYVGWFTQPQAITIGNTVDRILLHDYISNYSGLYSYIKTRLQYIAARNVLTKVIPIFSAEPSFMAPWLSTHNVITPYNDIQTALTNEVGSWKQYINLQGYQWFAYSFMPKNSTTTINKVEEDSEIKIFPNPARDLLTVQVNNEEIIKVEIINNIGQKINLAQNSSSNQITIDISSLKSGIYYCTVQSLEKKISQKIVVN